MAVSVHTNQFSAWQLFRSDLCEFIPETVRLPLPLSGPKLLHLPPTRICVPITVALILFTRACKVSIFYPLDSPYFVWGQVCRKWFTMSLYDFELLPHLPSTRICAPIHIASTLTDIFTKTQRVTSPKSSITLTSLSSSPLNYDIITLHF